LLIYLFLFLIFYLSLRYYVFSNKILHSGWLPTHPAIAIPCDDVTPIEEIPYLRPENILNKYHRGGSTDKQAPRKICVQRSDKLVMDLVVGLNRCVLNQEILREYLAELPAEHANTVELTNTAFSMYGYIPAYVLNPRTPPLVCNQ
jgi:hypothetical protein